MRFLLKMTYPTVCGYCYASRLLVAFGFGALLGSLYLISVLSFLFAGFVAFILPGLGRNEEGV